MSSDLEMITVWWDFIIFEKNQNRSDFFLDLMMKYQIHTLFWSVYTKVTPDMVFWDTLYKIQTFLRFLSIKVISSKEFQVSKGKTNFLFFFFCKNKTWSFSLMIKVVSNSIKDLKLYLWMNSLVVEISTHLYFFKNPQCFLT